MSHMHAAVHRASIGGGITLAAGLDSKCHTCLKTVYAMEKLKYEAMTFHKWCFKCAKCSSVLTISKAVIFEGEVYCGRHFDNSTISKTGHQKLNLTSPSTRRRESQASLDGKDTCDLNHARLGKCRSTGMSHNGPISSNGTPVAMMASSGCDESPARSRSQVMRRMTDLHDADYNAHPSAQISALQYTKRASPQARQSEPDASVANLMKKLSEKSDINMDIEVEVDIEMEVDIDTAACVGIHIQAAEESVAPEAGSGQLTESSDDTTNLDTRTYRQQTLSESTSINIGIEKLSGVTKDTQPAPAPVPICRTASNHSHIAAHSDRASEKDDESGDGGTSNVGVSSAGTNSVGAKNVGGNSVATSVCLRRPSAASIRSVESGTSLASVDDAVTRSGSTSSNFYNTRLPNVIDLYSDGDESSRDEDIFINADEIVAEIRRVQAKQSMSMLIKDINQDDLARSRLTRTRQTLSDDDERSVADGDVSDLLIQLIAGKSEKTTHQEEQETKNELQLQNELAREIGELDSMLASVASEIMAVREAQNSGYSTPPAAAAKPKQPLQSKPTSVMATTERELDTYADDEDVSSLTITSLTLDLGTPNTNNSFATSPVNGPKSKQTQKKQMKDKLSHESDTYEARRTGGVTTYSVNEVKHRPVPLPRPSTTAGHTPALLDALVPRTRNPMSGAALSHPMLADSDDGEEIELLRATSNGFLKAVEDEDHVRTPSRTHSLLITATYDSEHDTRDVDDYGEGALSDVESCPRKQVQVQTNSARGQSAKVLVRPRDSKCSSVGLAGYGHPSKPHPQTQAVKDAVMVRSSSPLARPTHGQTPQIHPPTHTSISIQATHTIDTPTTSGSGRSASPTNTSVQTHVTLPASGTHTVASAFYLETDPESSAHDHTGTNEPRTAPHTTVDNKRGQGITVAEVGRPLRGSIRSTSESDLAAMAAALPTASAVKRRPKPQPMRCSAPVPRKRQADPNTSAPNIHTHTHAHAHAHAHAHSHTHTHSRAQRRDAGGGFQSLTQSQLRMFKQGLARGQDDSDVSDDSTGHHDAEWLRDEALRKPLVLRGGDFVVEPIVGHCAEGSQYQLDIRNNTGFYQSYFFGKEHVNYFAIDQYLGKLVISIRKERVRSNDPNMKDAQYRVCFRSEMSEDENLVIPDTWVKGWKKSKRASMATSKVAIRDVINFALPRLQLLTKLTAPASEKESLGANLSMLLLDKDELIKAYKFGVMYCKEGQTTENAMFANEHGSEHYNDFLELIGSKVRLNGFKSFRGGLDVKGDTTGKYSVFTFWNNLEIMLHVSTLLPFQADNEQQLFRKAHIGNDIVVLVYVEGDAVFDPAALVAQFPHVFIVVRLERTEPTRRYRVEVAARKGVPEFLPQVPMYFEHDSKLRDFILSKMINGENASYKAPKFRKIRQRTRRLLLNNLFDEFMPGLSPK